MVNSGVDEGPVVWGDWNTTVRITGRDAVVAGSVVALRALTVVSLRALTNVVTPGLTVVDGAKVVDVPGRPVVDVPGRPVVDVPGRPVVAVNFGEWPACVATVAVVEPEAAIDRGADVVGTVPWPRPMEAGNDGPGEPATA